VKYLWFSSVPPKKILRCLKTDHDLLFSHTSNCTFLSCNRITCATITTHAVKKASLNKKTSKDISQLNLREMCTIFTYCIDFNWGT
jgi:hypothetical protein